MGLAVCLGLDAPTSKETLKNVPLKHAYKLPKPIMETLHKFLTRPSQDFSNRFLRALRAKFASKTGHVAKEAWDGVENRSEADAGEYKARTAPDNF